MYTIQGIGVKKQEFLPQRSLRTQRRPEAIGHRREEGYRAQVTGYSRDKSRTKCKINTEEKLRTQKELSFGLKEKGPERRQGSGLLSSPS